MAHLLPLSPTAFFRRYTCATLASAILFIASAVTAYSWEPQWRDITPEELAMTEPKLDPEAGAEVLIKEMRVDDVDRKKATFETYVRIKVFDERGVEALKPINVEVYHKRRITNIAARVIKPDGTSVYLDPKDVYTRELYQRNEVRVRANSFSLPGLEPGCIVEYQWEERFYDGWSHGTQFLFQGILPTHHAVFRIRPFPGIRQLATYFGLEENALKQERGGWKMLEVRDLPALPDEPYLPPKYTIQPWIMVVYNVDYESKFKPEEYWKERSRGLYYGDDDVTKPDRSIKQKADALTAGLPTNDEKLRAIYNFCTTQITHIGSDTSGYSVTEIDQLKDNKNASDVLKNGYGWSDDITYLFTSLAKAAGFEACLVRVNRKNSMPFDKNAVMDVAVPDLLSMVKLDGTGKFFAPGDLHIPYGRLHWTNEGVPALVPNRKEADLRRTDSSPIEYTTVQREAHLKIDESGDLSGVIKIIYGGHEAVALKHRYDALSPKERADMLASYFAEGLQRPELYKVEFINIDDREKPLEVRFEIKVPAYGESTGRRIFFEPSFFQKGRKPRLTREKRDFDLHFPYPWSMNDVVWIEYPEGWELEEAAAPQSMIDSETLSHLVTLGASKSSNRIRYTRFEKQSLSQAPVSVYPALKDLYEAINEQDHHIVTIRKSESTETQEEAPSEEVTAAK